MSKVPKFNCPECKRPMNLREVFNSVETKGMFWWKKVIGIKKFAHLTCTNYIHTRTITVELVENDDAWSFNELRMETIYDCRMARLAAA